MNIKSGEHSRGIRLTAFAVAFVFTATSVTWSTPAIAAPADVTVPIVSSLDTLVIPAEMGTISKEYGVRGTEYGENSKPGTPYAARRTVILIQDAHAVITPRKIFRRSLGFSENNTVSILPRSKAPKAGSSPFCFAPFLIIP